MIRFISTAVLALLIVLPVSSQEFFTIMDFEEETPPEINADWNHIFDFSFEGEPVYEGDHSLILIIDGTTGGWRFSTWNFPDEIGTVDLSISDEMNIWVNADQPFQMNFEFGGANLGYRGYTEEDLGAWKKLAWWYPPETAASFTEISSWGSFINPAAFGGFPEGYTGQIYIDAISARIREPQPEREYLLLNGFNSDADLADVTVTEAYIDRGIVTGSDIAPTEGEGYLSVLLSDDTQTRFIYDITDREEFMQYDRIHFDLYMDGTASGGWGNFSFHVNIETPVEDGDPEVVDVNIVGGSYQAVATEQWHTFTAQYGPRTDTEGFEHQNLMANTVIPAFADPNSRVRLRIQSNGGGVEGNPLYIDNIRLSRDAGTDVEQWYMY